MTSSGHSLQTLDRVQGALLGLAVGDALGTTLEFAPRDHHPRVTELVGGGPFGLPPGCWTDDTSMALCLADSLLAQQNFDPHDVMQRFVTWWQTGESSSTGRCFDIGNITRQALDRFLRAGNPYAGDPSPDAAGNGSLMRLAPAVIFAGGDDAEASWLAREQSRLTHAAPEAVDACAHLAQRLTEAFRGLSREKILAVPSATTMRGRTTACWARAPN